MSELDQHTPDDFWRKTFDEAAETPPPRVWNEIERRLDESDEAKILPLWGAGFLSSRPFVWGTGVAAALALLLVGWWVGRTPSTEQPVAQRQMSQSQQSTPSTSLDAPALAAKSAQVPTVTSNQAGAESVVAAQPTASITRQRRAVSPTVTKQELASVLATKIPQVADALTAQPASNASFVATYNSPVAPLSPAMVTPLAKLINTDLPPTESDGQLAVEPLTGRPMQWRDISEIQRIVWFRPAELPAEPAKDQSKPTAREVWASVAMMPGAFDPSVSLRSSPTLAANSVTAQASARTVQSAVNSRANFSVAYQTGAGVQLSEHWSIESGIGYLAGRSTVESPTFQATSSAPVLIANANKTQATNSLYVDALRSSSQISQVSNSSMYYLDNRGGLNSSFSALYDAQKPQSLTNDYQYIQVPVQLGYQLRPRKKLGLAVLGGLLTNVFVRNTVGNDLVVTGKDGVYRPVSWAASMGARLRYRSSRRWSASLAGIYQPSLGSASQPASRVQTRPTSAGMSFGIDYHFN